MFLSMKIQEIEKDPVALRTDLHREIIEVSRSIRLLQDIVAVEIRVVIIVRGNITKRHHIQETTTNVEEVGQEAVRGRHHGAHQITGGQHPEDLLIRTETEAYDLTLDVVHLIETRKVLEKLLEFHERHRRILKQNVSVYSLNGGKTIAKHLSKFRRNFKSWHTTKSKFHGSVRHQLTFITREQWTMLLNRLQGLMHCAPYLRKNY